MSGPGARAAALLNMNRPREAVATAQAGLGADPVDSDLWCVLARAHLALGEAEYALGAADRAAGLGHPDEGWPHRIRAAALRRLRNGPAALDAGRVAVRLGPDISQNHVALADAMLAFPEYVCPRNPGPGGFVDRPGRYYGPWWYTRITRLEVHERVAEVAEVAVELGPDDTDALMTLAWARRLQGARRESKDLADRALELAPDDPHVHQQRAAILASRGRLSSAASGFGRAAVLDPGSGAAYDFAAVCRRAINRGTLVMAVAWFLGGRILESAIDPYAPGADHGDRYVLFGWTAAVCLVAALLPLGLVLRGLSRSERGVAVRIVRRSAEQLIRLASVAGLLTVILLAEEADSRGDEDPAVLAGVLPLVVMALFAHSIARFGSWARAALLRRRP